MRTSLKFGTSGLRSLAAELEGQAARHYASAFLRHLKGLGFGTGCKVFLGQDFRPSSPAIVADCAAAVVAAGLEPGDCGALPTPVVALHAMSEGCAAIMVTGSHIPANRNGLKFYVPAGEISKDDEAGILAALRDEPIADFDGVGADEADAAMELYFARFAQLLPEGALATVSGRGVRALDGGAGPADAGARLFWCQDGALGSNGWFCTDRH